MKHKPYSCEEQKLRDAIKLSDKNLMRVLEGMQAKYRYDILPSGKIELRLEIGLIQLLVEMQAAGPLKFDRKLVVPGDFGVKGKVLQSNS
jgi:hypothetical protein